jgi:hypothetical protein
LCDRYDSIFAVRNLIGCLLVRVLRFIINPLQDDALLTVDQSSNEGNEVCFVIICIAESN